MSLEDLRDNPDTAELWWCYIKNMKEGQCFELEIGIIDNSVEDFYIKIDEIGIGKLKKEVNIKGEDKQLKLSFIVKDAQGIVSLSHNYTEKSECFMMDYIQSSVKN